MTQSGEKGEQGGMDSHQALHGVEGRPSPVMDRIETFAQRSNNAIWIGVEDVTNGVEQEYR